MEPLKFKVKITAVGEVRDAEGQLISAEPIDMETEMTEAQLIDAGLPVPEEK